MKFRTPFLMAAAALCMTSLMHAQSQNVDLFSTGGRTSVTTIDKTAGEEVCFTLTAKDKNGNVRRDWNTTGNATTLTLKYGANPATTANTDTSMHSWSSDPLDFTYAKLLHNGVELAKITDNEWTIPSTDFDSLGQTRICLTHTRADTGVYIEVTPVFAGLNQESAHMNFKSGSIANYLIDITTATQKPDQVFVGRPYEIVVSPRDRYGNVSTESIKTRFTARFPGEFYANQPGLATIFSGDVFLTGPTNYLLASQIDRVLPRDASQLQWIMCYASDNNAITGRTNDYEILSHAPNDFQLKFPPNNSILNLDYQSTRQLFEWERPLPVDPYTDVQRSRFSPTKYSDDVTYTVVFLDSISLTRAVRFQSNSVGVDHQMSMSNSQLWDLMKNISGSAMAKEYTIAWYVEATDGLYTTLSNPPKGNANGLPGYYLHLRLAGADDVPAAVVPQKMMLEQNYPNPFNPTTNIRFSIPERGKVSLRVYDLLGGEVASLISNEERAAGDYTVNFNATSLPSGLYIYKLQFNGKTLTRRMTLMK